MKVYLAGRIEKNDWRHDIFSGLRDYTNGLREVPLVYANSINPDVKVEYNGPYFVGDDHGLYHGPNTHGRGIGRQEDEVMGEVLPSTRKYVLEKCLWDIDSSDIMFVWLDKVDAFGTISEIGYAKKAGIPIFLSIHEIFKDEIFSSDTWFIQEMSNWCEFAPNATVAWESFLSKVVKVPGEPFRDILDPADLKWIRTKTTEYAKKVVQDKTAEEVNKIDISRLTDNFIRESNISKRFECNGFSQDFKKQIATELDIKLVRAFVSKNSKYRTPTFSAKDFGLVYKFDVNYEREANWNERRTDYIGATIKQKRYILKLLEERNKTLCNSEKLSISDAGAMLDSLTEGKLPKGYKQYYEDISNSPEVRAKRREREIGRFIYNKKEVIAEFKRRTGKPLGHPMHNYLVMREGAVKRGLSELNRFSAEWLEYIVNLLKSDADYKRIRKEFKEATKS